MPITFDSILGIHGQALNLQAKRAEILAANLANADTPGYKARDVDFKQAMRNLMDDDMFSASHLKTTRPQHIQANTFSSLAEPGYRQATQNALDGNTVEPHVEIAQYTENSVRYMASLQFVNGKFSGLMTALRGE